MPSCRNETQQSEWQTATSEFEDLAARVNQTDEGRVEVHFKSEKS